MIAYLGQFGPLDSPPLDSPIDLIVMTALAIGSFAWSARSGGPTEELAEIVAAQANTQTRRFEARADVLTPH